MKKTPGWIAVPLVLLFALSASSCSKKPDEKTLASYAKGLSLFESGKFMEASRVLDNGTFLGFGAFAPASILKAKSFWFMGNSAEAEKELRIALRSRPSSIEGRIWLVRVLRSNGKKEEALRTLENALSDDPFDPRLLRLASELALDRADSVAACSYLDRAVEGGAELSLVFLDRARILWASGDGDAALGDISAAASLSRPGTTVHRAARALEKAIREASK